MKRTINIYHCYAIFTDNLKRLSVKYNIDTFKGDFPYNLARANTLFYKKKKYARYKVLIRYVWKDI